MPNSKGVLPDRTDAPMRSLQHSTVRPVGVYVLSGLAINTTGAQTRLLAVDAIRGYLVEVDPYTHNTTILNSHTVADWIGATGLAVWQDTIWFTQGESVFCSSLETLTPTSFTRLSYPANGVAVWESKVYVTCQKSGCIHIFDRESGKSLEKIRQPGIGIENITVTEDALWVCDRDEQTVYCLDRATGKLRYSALTPFSTPTGIAFYPQADGDAPICYVAYADEEPYIRDDPNAESPYQLTFRDRTFLHPLHTHYDTESRYTLSNGYLVELTYVEELLPLEDVPTLNNVEWRIALPGPETPNRFRA